MPEISLMKQVCGESGISLSILAWRIVCCSLRGWDNRSLLSGSHVPRGLYTLFFNCVKPCQTDIITTHLTDVPKIETLGSLLRELAVKVGFGFQWG